MYDLLVLAFNEEKSSSINKEEICVRAVNKDGKDKEKYYYEIWPFINNAYGILYKIFTPNGLGKYECCDEIFEFETQDNNNLNILRAFGNFEDSVITDYESIKLNEEYESEFMSIMKNIINRSPISTIAFLCRGQSLDKELILGNYSVENFIDMLRLSKVMTNICYIISK